MYQKYLLLLLASLPYVIFGQMVISSAGQTVSDEQVELYWTIGEPVITTQQNEGVFLTQGFQQGELEMTCRTQDSLVLVDLYNATDGANWTISWNLDAPMEEWFGVTLSGAGCVVRLELCQNCYSSFPDIVGNQLRGTLPSSLGNLSELEVLVITKNGVSYGGNLNGTMPVQLGNLTNLTRLWLYNNDLSGTIPTELGNLSNLARLSLGGNDLNGSIPMELGNLTNLTRLSLGSNDLSGTIPKELGNLINLTLLRVHNNNLSGCFPQELLTICSINYDFTANIQLPWQGDFERYCNEEEQIGAPCDDGNPNTDNDVITESCVCEGTAIENCTDVEIQLEQNICEGENYLFDNQNLSTTGIYTASYQSVSGCDSLLTLNLTVSQRFESTLMANICEDESYLFDNQNLTQAGVYTATYQTINGCDSIVTLILEDISRPISAEDDTYFLRSRNSSVQVEPLDNDNAPENIQFRLLEEITTGDFEWENEAKGIFKLQLAEPTTVEVFYELCDRDCPTVCDTASIYIQYFDKNTLEQTGFTPNNDGKNDFFVIPELEDDPTRYPKVSLTVFNRWGDLVFQAQPYLNNWDGRHIKTGKLLPAASYYYILRLDLGQGEIRYGQITIIR